MQGMKYIIRLALVCLFCALLSFPSMANAFGLSATLTTDGDGFGSSFSSGAAFESDFIVGVDLLMSLENTSATDTYSVPLSISFSSAVNSSGDDAFALSDFSLEDVAGDIFFNSLISDTLIGNFVDGVPTGGFGGPLADSGTFTTLLTLLPGEVLDLIGLWTWESGVYEDPGSAEIDFSSFISVDSIPAELLVAGMIGLSSDPDFDLSLNELTGTSAGGYATRVAGVDTVVPFQATVVPEPSTLLLFGFGLGGVYICTRRRRK